MGADGGYVYVKRSDLKRVLSETEIDLWLRFVSHSFDRDAYREDLVDVRAWESKNGFDTAETYRFPEGTDVDPKLWLGEEFVNPPEEVWYWKTGMEENLYIDPWARTAWSRGYDGHYWFNHPGTWYEPRWMPEERTYRYVLPAPDELDVLISVNKRLVPRLFTYLETWT